MFHIFFVYFTEAEVKVNLNLFPFDPYPLFLFELSIIFFRFLNEMDSDYFPVVIISEKVSVAVPINILINESSRFRSLFNSSYKTRYKLN